LKALWIRKTKVTDKGIGHLVKCPKINFLDLGYTSVTDEGVKTLATFKQLERLYLDQTKVTDAAVKDLALLRKLESLGLLGTNVTANAAEELRKALPKCNVMGSTKQSWLTKDPAEDFIKAVQEPSATPPAEKPAGAKGTPPSDFPWALAAGGGLLVVGAIVAIWLKRRKSVA
jgi:hypothetical protein